MQINLLRRNAAFALTQTQNNRSILDVRRSYSALALGDLWKTSRSIIYPRVYLNVIYLTNQRLIRRLHAQRLSEPAKITTT